MISDEFRGDFKRIVVEKWIRTSQTPYPPTAYLPFFLPKPRISLPGRYAHMHMYLYTVKMAVVRGARDEFGQLEMLKG